MSFDKYLEEIGDLKRPLTTVQLMRLASLSSEEKGILAAFWPKINPARKERIARVLAELAEDNVELNFDDAFRLCLDDPMSQVRIAGIEGLFECKERWYLNKLVSMVHDDPSAEVRAATALALGSFALEAEIGDLRPRDVEKVDETLLAVFEKETESPEVRRRALESIGVRSDEKAADAIAKAYASDQHQLKIGAIYAMGRSCDERWLSTLVKELSNPDPELRYEAVIACGELEDERAVPYLVALLQDEDTQVRVHVVTALGHIGGQRAKDEIKRCLQHPDGRIKEAAEEALEELTFSEDPLTFG